MKKRHRHHVDSSNCACLSCKYKGISDRPSLRHFLKLQRQIPHKEKLLLEKLARTRAVYDDLRVKLISDSTLSSMEKPNLNPERKFVDTDLPIDKSSTILELVNFIDQGANVGHIHPSDCCNCCICYKRRENEKKKLKGQKEKIKKYQHAKRKYGDERRQKREVKFKPKYVRSDPCVCAIKFSDLIIERSKTLLKKLRHEHSAPNMTLNVEGQRQLSVPDADVLVVKRLQRIGNIVKSSYEKINEPIKHAKNKIQEGAYKIETSANKIRESIKAVAKDSLEKLKNIKEKKKLNICECPIIPFDLEAYLNVKATDKNIKEAILEGAKKLRESTNRIEENIQVVAKQSLEKIKSASHKIKQNIKSEAIALKEAGNIALKIKKDSLIKFKDDLKKKKLLKYWTCEPECVKDICVPEECFKKLKQKNYRKSKKLHRSHRKYKKSKNSMEKFSEIIPSVNMKTGTNKLKTSMRAEQTNKNINRRVGHGRSKVSIHKVASARQDVDRKLSEKHRKIARLEKISHPLTDTPESEKTKGRRVVRIGSSFNFSVEIYKQKQSDLLIGQPHAPKISAPNIIKFKKTIKPKTGKRHHGSQVIIKRSPKDNQYSNISLKRCFCSLKLKSKRFKKHYDTAIKKSYTSKSATSSKYANSECRVDPSRCKNQICDPEKCLINVKNRAAGVGTRKANEGKSIIKLSKSRNYQHGVSMKKKHELLPYECEPGICSPSYCNPYECVKLINKRSKTKKKSVSSLTIPSKTQQIQSYVTDQNKKQETTNKIKQNKDLNSTNIRQAVKIGSSFKFNIEIYKTSASEDERDSDNKNLIIKPKIKPQIHSKERSFKQKHIKTSKKSTTTNLKRCFCTLTLKKKKHTKKHVNVKMHSASTKTSGTLNVDMYSKGTKTFRRNYNLDHFKCKPNICIPGKCDPYACLEKNNKLSNRLKSVGQITLPTKTTTLSTTYRERKKRFVKTQSTPITKNYKSQSDMQDSKKYAVQEKRAYSGESFDTTKRQAVKIGTAFSFNIEFTKNQYPAIDHETNVKKKPSINPEKRKKNKAIKKQISKMYHIETQATAKKINKALTVKPLLKRCFCTLNLMKNLNHQNLKKRPLMVYTANEIVTTNIFTYHTNNKL